MKDEYTYNPTKAKELLTEAGYPDGFKMKLLMGTGSQQPTDLFQIFKAYFKEIGVEMEIEVMEGADDYIKAGKHNGIAEANGGLNWPPNRLIDQYYSGGADAAVSGVKWGLNLFVNDLRDQFLKAQSSDEIATAYVRLDKHLIVHAENTNRVGGGG